MDGDDKETEESESDSEDDPNKVPDQVFQNRSGLGDATFYERLTFSFLKPYIARAHKGKVSVAQCGNLRDEDKIDYDLNKFNAIYTRKLQNNESQALQMSLLETYFKLMVYLFFSEIGMGL
jgi:hypothetical protein